MSDYSYDLGSHSRTITTQSAEAQIWFDRGLNWIYGYHHEEAGECFKKVLEHDPDCPMAHWGLAYIIGPNYNKPWELFDEKELATALSSSRASLENAQKKLPEVSAVEKALIHKNRASISS